MTGDHQPSAGEAPAPAPPQEPAHSAGGSPSPTGPLGEDERPETFEFEHKIFHSGEQAVFRRATDGSKEAVLMLNMGDARFILPLPGIRREFGLEETDHDSRLMELVEEALYYVREVRIGDPLPKEMITGEASFTIGENHRLIAHQRLTVQLAHWMTGDQSLITDPEQLAQIAEDPEMRHKVKLALKQAAKELGFATPEDDGSDQVLDRIEKLAEDLAGVEALRERVDQIHLIHKKLEKLIRRFGGEMSVIEIATPVARLLKLAIKEFEEDFEMLDAQTGEIMAVLRHLEAQTKFIRDTRDDLRNRLDDWDEMFEIWGPASCSPNEQSVNLLRKTYRFLAPRFMQVDTWELQGQLQEAERKRQQAKAQCAAEKPGPAPTAGDDQAAPEAESKSQDDAA